jgi:hypothetical protein
LNAEIGCLRAFEDSACMTSGKLHDIQKIGAVTDQPGGFDIGVTIECWGDRSPQRQLGDMCAVDVEKSVGAEPDRVAGLLRVLAKASPISQSASAHTSAGLNTGIN